MCGFQLNSAEEISVKHALVIKFGGADEGGSSVCSDRFFAYVRDLGGNKLCLFE
jgi:hypothetical protein